MDTSHEDTDHEDPHPSKAAVQAAFGRNLRICRHRAGLSQAQLAALGGLHWSYIGQIERGERNLTMFNILRLSWGLELPVEDLLAGIGPWATQPTPTAPPTRCDRITGTPERTSDRTAQATLSGR